MPKRINGVVVRHKVFDANQVPPPGMHVGAPLHYPRKRREHWPFLFYEEHGQLYLNDTPPAKRKTKVQDFDIGEALW